MDSAYAVILAMRNAIAAARKDAGNEEWFDMGMKCNKIFTIKCMI